MGLGFFYHLYSFLFGEENLNNVQRSIIDFIVEKANDFTEFVLGYYNHLYAIIFELLDKLYATTFGKFVDFILGILDFSKDSFVKNGRIFVDGVFDKFSFTSIDFTENFIFWFIGLLIFACISKYVFSFTFGLIKSIIDLLLGI